MRPWRPFVENYFSIFGGSFQSDIIQIRRRWIILILIHLLLSLFVLECYRTLGRPNIIGLINLHKAQFKSLSWTPILFFLNYVGEYYITTKIHEGT